MKKYSMKIEPEALADIREITDWYNEQQAGLGKQFQNTAIKQINSLSKSPQIHAIRYKEIRCMIIKNFPYMVHFYINDNNDKIEIFAVISTSRDPKIWTKKTGKRKQ